MKNSDIEIDIARRLRRLDVKLLPSRGPFLQRTKLGQFQVFRSAEDNLHPIPSPETFFQKIKLTSDKLCQKELSFGHKL